MPVAPARAVRPMRWTYCSGTSGMSKLNTCVTPVDVDAARGDVGRDEDRDLARAEVGERALALRLALVAVDRARGEPRGGQVADDAVGAVLGAAEHQRAADLIFAQLHRQQRLLLALVDVGDELLDALGGAGDGRHRDLDRIAQELVRELADRLGHGRREEQRLALLGEQRHDALERVDEAQVEHLVGLVEHEDLDVLERQRALVDQVEQPAGGGDEDVDARLELADLAVDRHAAEHGDGRQAQPLAIGVHALGDLAGELARRREHQHAATARRARLGVLLEIVERGQAEGGGLAGAGLRDAEQVAALHQRRDRLRLDRGGLGIALGGKRGEDRGGEAQVGELGQDEIFHAKARRAPFAGTRRRVR